MSLKEADAISSHRDNLQSASSNTRVIVFFVVCFLYLFCFSQVGILVKFPTTGIRAIVAYWRMQIEDYLYDRKLHLPLLGTKPEAMKAEEWTLLDRQVLGVIKLTLSRSVAHNVVKEKTIADLMKALSGMYERPSANNKVHLMKKLFNLKMAENASVA